MGKIRRVVVPGIPHHLTQRGNRRLPTFFSDSDFLEYKRLLRDQCEAHKVSLWAYCLMTNHVHFIAVPSTERSLSQAFGEAHRRYARRIHFRENWRGYFWQGRFSSYPMDEGELLLAARYIELNPVLAGIVKDPGEYPWSSAQHHLLGKPDTLISGPYLLSLIPDWAAFLAIGIEEAQIRRMEKQFRTGRPLGNSTFIENIERALGRSMQRGTPGRKPGRPTAARK